MAGGPVSAGVSTFSGTLVASTVDTVTFADRYSYVLVENTGTGTIYATADGSTPTGVAGAGSGVAIAAGASGVLANGLSLWFQSSKVIAQGSNNAQQQSKAGQMANPGTTVKLVSSSTPSYTVSGTG